MPDLNAISTWSALLVEDEPDNVEVISEVLQFHGLTVKAARNGLDGLELLKSFTPDIILLDISMPQMDGWEMLKRIKADPKLQAIPVVAISAHAMHGDKENALAVGFDGYLTKPIQVATLLDDLRAELQGPVADSTSSAAAPSIQITRSNDGQNGNKAPEP